ncbi:adhesion G-protein coupled receptor G5-like [Embiotoca jacksoni]|uniref:adhesion G-protein coupled receptor G5-like n=1 Tax=Embiotoca jacksoni TaxID=100190 RepID=UPI0037043F2C
MEPRPADQLRTVFFFIVLLSPGSCDNDLYLEFCGTWYHGRGPLSLNLNLSTGCDAITILANESSLSISGKITSQCQREEVLPFKQLGLDSQEDSDFCLYWEPLLDQLKLQIGGKNLTLCWPASLQDSCCTDLSYGPKTPVVQYGIGKGRVWTDNLSTEVHSSYMFGGQSINCMALCYQATEGSAHVNTPQETTLKSQNIKHPCAHRSEVELKEDLGGYNVTSPTTAGESSESTTTVHLPPALKHAAKPKSKVVLSFFTNNSMFQVGNNETWTLNNVVGITVGNKANEVIKDLSEPIRIGFHHDVIPKMYSRKCVSWDTREDPWQVNWLVDGCETRQGGANHTECLCNHLTYFTVLVQLKPRPVRHLLALTVITYLGCAISLISCVVLIIFLCRKRRRSDEQSIPIHMGLAGSLALLSLLFFFTGVLANVGGEIMCAWVGPALHYALLSSLTWMGIEVFHTFWLVYMVFSLSPEPYIWNLVGFVVPVVPVIILVSVGDIYGLREVVQSDDISNPYRMCWMKVTHKAMLAHYFTNMTILTIMVLSGFVMLFLVYKKIRIRDEWRQNRVAFLSIWGLSCLFGTTWGLTFLDFEPLSDFILFLSCILNAFQGFLLMLRFCMLDWMRKQAGGSPLGSTSSGSTRQHMLQASERR